MRSKKENLQKENIPCKSFEEKAVVLTLTGGTKLNKKDKRSIDIYISKTQKNFFESILKDTRNEGIIISSERCNMPFLGFSKKLGYLEDSDQYLTYSLLVPYLNTTLNPESKSFDKIIYNRIKPAIPVIKKIAKGRDRTSDFSNLDIIHLNGNRFDLSIINLMFIEQDKEADNYLIEEHIFNYLTGNKNYFKMLNTIGGFEIYANNQIKSRLSLTFNLNESIAVETMIQDKIRKDQKLYVYNGKKYISTEIPYFLLRKNKSGEDNKFKALLRFKLGDIKYSICLKALINNFCNLHNIKDRRIFIKTNKEYEEVIDELYEP